MSDSIENKPYRLWAGDENNKVIGLQCLFQPKCAYCNANMEFWCCKPHKFSINDGDDVKRSHALDIEVSCPECGSWEAFGVAISREHYEHITKWGRRQPNKGCFRVVDENRDEAKKPSQKRAST